MIAGRLIRSANSATLMRAEALGEAPPVGIGSRRPLILVVEDDRHDWEIYGKILWYNGYDVMFAPDGEAGLSLARQHLPDLILLDLVMPNLDGMTLCRLLKKDVATAKVPIIILSGKPYNEAGSAARRAGCSIYLEKPTSPVEVLHHVEELIGRAPLPGDGPAPQKFPPGA